MRRAAALLACWLASSACAYHIQRVGDDRFLSAPIEWQPGKTTVGDVVLAFGPPDMVRWSEGRLLFVYRAERSATSGLIVNVYLRLISAEAKRHEDATLIVAFDDRDRLLYHGESDQPRRDYAGDIGLRALWRSIF